jgi:hypothetical protein
LLALLLLTRLDLLSRRGCKLGFGLRNRRVLQFDLVAQIVECGLRDLRDLRLVHGGIDLHQEIAGLDALQILRGHRQHLAGDAAARHGHRHRWWSGSSHDRPRRPSAASQAR